VSTVNNAIRAIDAFHADRAARFAAEARRARIAHEIRTARPAARLEGRRIRRAVGRSIVRLGARIAADPAAERGVLAVGRSGTRPTTYDGVLIP
jgi:hypothetical protein